MLDEKEKNLVMEKAKELALRILTGNIKPEDGCSEIAKLAFQLDLPNRLQPFVYLDEGTASECRRKTWFGIRVFDQKMWLESLMKESRFLIDSDK
jgi:hypothetical protein